MRGKNRCTRAVGHAVYRARYYNPYISRFINPDPSGFSGGLNFYAFADGNPVSLIDPFGLGAKADSANVSIFNPNLGQVPGNPCFVCHGSSAYGFNGNVNSFFGLSAIPGSGPNAQQGYSTLVTLSEMVAPLVAAPVGGAIAEGLGVGYGTLALAEATTLGIEATTVAAETTASLTMLVENDVVIGLVKDGQVISQAALGSDYATAVSHEYLAQQAGVWVGRGTLNEGVEAFTVFKQGGSILIRGSNNFNPTVSSATQTLLRGLFH